jgi:hypothetical protein
MRQSMIEMLVVDTQQFRTIEDKAERIRDLANKRLTKSLLLQCQDFKSLLFYTWVDIITDSGLLNKLFIESFEQAVCKQSSSKLYPMQKIMLFQIYTNLISQQHPAATTLKKLWPANLERNMLVSANFSDCSKIDQLINDDNRKGAFAASITPGFLIQNIYYSKKDPKTMHPIFLQRIKSSAEQKSNNPIIFINTLMVHRHLKHTDGLIFEFENFDNAVAESIAKEIRCTFD